MWKFVLGRLLLAFPTVLLVLTGIFALLQCMPGDRVSFALQSLSNFGSENSVPANQYNQMAERLGAHYPLFYFSIVPRDYPREIFELDYLQRKFAFGIIKQYGHPRQTIRLTFLINNAISDGRINEYPGIKNLLNSFETNLSPFKTLETPAGMPVDLQRQIADIRQLAIDIDSHKSKSSSIPRFHWHGGKNQYHVWMVRGLTGDLGTSIIDGQPVVYKIFQAIRWTLIINVPSILLAYFLSILVGSRAGWFGGWFDGISTIILFILYATPLFWFATILVVFFTTPQYGAWTNIFPPVGVWEGSSSDSFLQLISKNMGRFIIPILVLSTSLMAYLTRIMRNSVIEEKNKEYVQYAHIKGLSQRQILWKHVFRNASFPLVTIFGGVLPLSISGSLVLEVICNIPGSGRLLYYGILDQDWNLVQGVVVIASILTIIGLIFSDLMYQWLDPRVKLDRS